MSRKKQFAAIQKPTQQHLLHEFKPRTINQAHYVRSIVESDVTLVHGPSGTGKSFIAIGLACEHLVAGKISGILISRSIVECGRKMGAMPGDVKGKIEPYMMPYVEYLEYFLGKPRFMQLFAEGKVKLFPVELLRGHTIDDSFMILDEAQNCNPSQIKLFLTRLGANSTAIVIGDDKQSDIDDSGFHFCLKYMSKIDGLSVARLDITDVQRHPIIPQILEVFENHGI